MPKPNSRPPRGWSLDRSFSWCQTCSNREESSYFCNGCTGEAEVVCREEPNKFSKIIKMPFKEYFLFLTSRCIHCIHMQFEFRKEGLYVSSNTYWCQYKPRKDEDIDEEEESGIEAEQNEESAIEE